MRLYLLLLFVTILVLPSCQDFDPASPQEGPTKLVLGNYMQGTGCSMADEGIELNVRVRVYRDEYLGEGAINYNVLQHSYILSNDMSNTDNTELEEPDSFGIPMSIPDNGSYALRVEISGFDCFSCCNGPACGNGYGQPLILSQEVIINQSYRPLTVQLETELDRCE